MFVFYDFDIPGSPWWPSTWLGQRFRRTRSLGYLTANPPNRSGNPRHLTPGSNAAGGRGGYHRIQSTAWDCILLVCHMVNVLEPWEVLFNSRRQFLRICHGPDSQWSHMIRHTFKCSETSRCLHVLHVHLVAA
jgi:hypothetical protein